MERYIKLADEYMRTLITNNPANIADVESVLGHLPHWRVLERDKQTCVLLNKVIARQSPNYIYERYKIGTNIYIDVIFSDDFSQVVHIFPAYALKRPDKIKEFPITLNGVTSVDLEGYVGHKYSHVPYELRGILYSEKVTSSTKELGCF